MSKHCDLILTLCVTRETRLAPPEYESFQPVRRCIRHDDVRRRLSGFIIRTRPRVEEIWVLVQARYHVLLRPRIEGLVYRMNYSYLYKLRQTEKSFQLKLAAVEWLLLWSHDKLGVADWITSAQDHADSVNLEVKTETKQMKFCSLPVKLLRDAVPWLHTKHAVPEWCYPSCRSCVELS